MSSHHHRWQDGHIRLAPLETPAKQAALALALYGIRVQCERPLGTVEAIIEIRDAAGTLHGRLNLDHIDADWLLRVITKALDDKYGPMRGSDIRRLIAEKQADKP